MPRLIVWTPRLDGTGPDGAPIPALEGATEEQKARLLDELARFIAGALRHSLSIQARFEPGLAAVCQDGLYVAVEGDDKIAIDANRVPAPPPNAVLLCFSCHRPMGDRGPYLRAFCQECVEKEKHPAPAPLIVPS